MTHGVFAHVRGRVGSGLLIVLPTLITVWLLGLLFNLINAYVTPVVLTVLTAAGVSGLDLWPARIVVPVVGLVITAGSVYLIGLLAGNLMGRRVVYWVEAGILRIPLVKGIYGAARQLLDAFSMTGSRAFSKVVLLEYPRHGLWTVGFVTSERMYHLADPASGSAPASVPIFLPTTPNPTSGWLILARPEELWIVDITIEEAVKLIVSGGIVGPQNFGRRIRKWDEGPTGLPGDGAGPAPGGP